MVSNMASGVTGYWATLILGGICGLVAVAVWSGGQIDHRTVASDLDRPAMTSDARFHTPPELP